jgi:hypothetical protein
MPHPRRDAAPVHRRGRRRMDRRARRQTATGGPAAPLGAPPPCGGGGGHRACVLGASERRTTRGRSHAGRPDPALGSRAQRSSMSAGPTASVRQSRCAPLDLRRCPWRPNSNSENDGTHACRRTQERARPTPWGRALAEHVGADVTHLEASHRDRTSHAPIRGSAVGRRTTLGPACGRAKRGLGATPELPVWKWLGDCVLALAPRSPRVLKRALAAVDPLAPQVSAGGAI